MEILQKKQINSCLHTEYLIKSDQNGFRINTSCLTNLLIFVTVQLKK